MGTIISCCNQKGGVGKTTTTLNLGTGLAKLGQRVLLVDLDTQTNLSTTLRHDGAGPGANELLYYQVAKLPHDADQLVRVNDGENLDFIPASKMLAAAPSFLANDSDSNTVLSRALRQPCFSQYDYILIDCKPSLDLLVVNALVASDKLIVPVEPEDYAVDGLVDLWDTVSRIQKTSNPNLKIAGILLTKVDVRRNSSRRIEQELRECFGDLVFEAVIPNLAEAVDATQSKQSLVNGKSRRLGALYQKIAEVILNG